MIKLPEAKTEKDLYSDAMMYKKKMFGLIVLLNFIFSFIYLAISHGSLPMEECFPYILLYSTAVFGLYQYETYKAICVVRGKQLILLLGSTIGAFIRVIICLIFVKTQVSLYVFGIVNLVDFYIRSLIYKKKLMESKENIVELV